MIKAVEDKVVVVLLKRTKSTGGIILPETFQEPQAYGRVISVGEKAANKGIKEGDILVSHIRGGMDLVFDLKLVKVLKLDEIYGLLTDETTLEALEDLTLEQSKEPSKLVKL